MVKLYNNFNIDKKYKRSIILIGNFDGVHLGHQKIFNLAKKYKKKYNLKVGVINFDPMPKMFFNKSLKNFRLSNINQKINLLKEYEVDFTDMLRNLIKISLKPCSSISVGIILSQKLDAKFIFVSNNFRFGNKREGDVDLLIDYEKNYNYKVIKIFFTSSHKIISSTLIRNLLEKGYLDKANKHLDRNWCIEGTVQKGRQMGKKMGFPTCNIDIKDYVIAMPGGF